VASAARARDVLQMSRSCRRGTQRRSASVQNCSWLGVAVSVGANFSNFRLPAIVYVFVTLLLVEFVLFCLSYVRSVL